MKTLLTILILSLLISCNYNTDQEQQTEVAEAETPVTPIDDPVEEPTIDPPVVIDEPEEDPVTEESEPPDEIDDPVEADPIETEEIEDDPIVEQDEAQDTTSDTPEIVEDPIPQETTNPVILTLLTDSKLYFYDGEFTEASNDNPVLCGYRCFTDGSLKKTYDEFGNIVESVTIVIEPDFILDDWIVENISPVEALAMGARYKDYTRYYFQGVEQDFWFLNQYKVTDLIKTNLGEIVAIEGNNYHALSSELQNINHAKDLLIYDFDAINRTAIIDNVPVSWETNYFNQAKDWLEADDIWYSWNGYEFDSNLSENANSMWNWNIGVYPVQVAESPTILGAGTREENSEIVLYWIECNTGWMIRYVPSYDRLETVYRLYMGDGLRMTGINNSDILKPALIDGDLYFNYDGSIWKLEIDSGIVSLFFGGNGKVERW